MNWKISLATPAVTLALLSGVPFAAAREKLEIRLLSSPRADLVSGGDALIELRGAGSAPEISVNGKPATIVAPDTRHGSFTGLVSNLEPGRNEIVVRDGRQTARLALINHSKDGPILSGPHMWPLECRTERADLGAPIDRMWNAPTRVDYYYRTSDGSFKPYDRNNRPGDVATTTTIDGRTLPYIVRIESGTLNRTIYRIAVLDDPDAPQGQVWKPGAGWNGRLAVRFEGGNGGRYEQGSNRPIDALNDLYLSRGFAYTIASGLANGVVANAVLQGETLMMLKEQFIERYGVPKWTVGSGGSGGAIQQLHITALYPGLLDGLQPEVGFADSQITTQAFDCDLLENYWKKTGGESWTDEKKAAVSGFATASTCKNIGFLSVNALKPAHKPACGLSDQSLVYDARSNPKGVRCGPYAWLVNEIGRDPKTGFARSPLDNVGVQYGLKALNDGKISADEFLDLNEKIGGHSVDMEFVPARTTADETTLRLLYSTGLVNSGGGGLANVPIISYRKYQDPFGDLHDRQRDFEVRLRLERANGDAKNQIIWVGPKGKSLTAPSPVVLDDKVLDAMTKWLDALAADPAPLSHRKVIRLRPAEAVDAWFDADGAKHPEPANLDPSTRFNTEYPVFGNPRIAAGGPATNDLLKCRLKPVSASGYKIRFTPEQMQRLKAIFPNGVCDFSKAGVGQVKQEGTYRRY